MSYSLFIFLILSFYSGHCDYLSGFSPARPGACSSGQFACTSGQCIPIKYLCDGDNDCDDHSDEPSDCPTKPCGEGHMTCLLTSRCLPLRYKCDLEFDCGVNEVGVLDTSDEDPNICNKTKACASGEHRCTTGNQCVHLSKFCDGHEDCDDGSDEHPFCGVDKLSVDVKCKYGGAVTMDSGFECYCPQGQTPSGADCIDEDECKGVERGLTPVCSQKCINLIASRPGDIGYRCECAFGFELINNTWCKSSSNGTSMNGTVPTLLAFGSMNLLHKKLNDPKGLNLDLIQVPEVLALAVDQTRKESCFATAKLSSSLVSDAVTCISLDTNGSFGRLTRISVPYSFEGVVSMDYDWLGNNFYMADIIYFRVFACNRKFEHCITLAGNKIDKPSGIAVDPTVGVGFVADWGTETGGIWRMKLDGSELIPLVDSGIIHPTGLTLDIYSKTVYWADRYLEIISGVDYNNQFRKREIGVGRVVKGVSSMFHFERWLYAANDKYMIKYDVMQDSAQRPTQYVETDITKMEIVRLLHETMQPIAEHPCNLDNGNCDQLCLVGYLVTVNDFRKGHAICACAEGYRLVDGRKCIAGDQKQGPLLIMGRTRPGSIVALSINALMEDNFPSVSEPSGSIAVMPKIDTDGMPPIRHLRRPTAITMNIEKQELYFSDARNYSIHRRKVYATDIEDVIDTGVSNCEGLAYDWSSRNLYLSDQAFQHVMVLRVDQTNLRRVIMSGNLSNPRALVIHPAKSYLFVADWTQTPVPESSLGLKAKIERTKLDGSNRKILIGREIVWPNGLAVDFENDWLYWCDAYYDKIERVRYNGADRQVVISGKSLNHPYGLALYRSFIFWTELSQVNRLKIDQHGAVGNSQVVYRDHSPVFELFAYDPEAKLPMSPCSKDNGGCSQFCFATGCKGTPACAPFVCACADGYQIDPMNPKLCTVDANATNASRCKQSEFECLRNKRCIKKRYLCDGDDDCGDGSDESNAICADFKCPSTDFFKCNHTNMCTQQSWVCDGLADCPDGEDEDQELCKDRMQCSKKHFKCAKSKRCIPLSAKCDGENDCGLDDESDELECEAEDRDGCGIGHFQCLNARCIAWNYVCDGSLDCRDGSDERNCHEGCLPGVEFRCADGLPCMSVDLLCDGVNDCDDGSDESNETCPRAPKHRYCASVNQWKCESSDQCIRKSFRCDGQKDCFDGSDEMGCGNITCKTQGEFQCVSSRKCIPMKFRCDGHRDCDDGSDEAHCSSKLLVSADRCVPPMFLCTSGERNICLPAENVCNGIAECPMGDDEGFFCDDEPCVGAPCEHHCHERPSGYICSCKSGYKLAQDGHKCIKEEPCTFGSCSQHCWPQSGVGFCYCEPGFELMPDKFTCKSTDTDNARIIFTNRHEIRMLALHKDASSFPLVSHLRNSIAIDYYYDKPGELLFFWTDIAADIVYRGLLKGQALSDVQPIISYGIWTAEGIAVDWMAKNIYWVDSWLGQIEVANFDGTMRATVMRENMKNLRALTLDPSKGFMFWTDWEESNPRIERATMAGNNRTVLFEVLEIVNGGWPNGLSCDFVAERIYWIDAKSDSIHTITYDGEDHREIIRDSLNLAHPFAISVFGNYVYWTDWRVTAVVKANKWNGSDVRIVEGTSMQPFDLKIIHKSRQPRGTKNPCRDKNGGCSHICLIDSPTARVCACPYTMQLSSDNHSCQPVNSTLIVASRTAIRTFDAQRPGLTVFPVIAGKDVQNIRAIAVDSVGSAVFWSDDTKGAISKIYLNGTGGEATIVWKDVANCDGIAVDGEAEVMYFTSWSSDDNSSSISVASVDGLYRQVLISSATFPALRKPEGLVLDSKNGRMYWLDRDYIPVALFTATMSGEEVMQMKFKEANVTHNARFLAIDPVLGILYWVQPHLELVRAITLKQKGNSMVHELAFSKSESQPVGQITVNPSTHELLYYNWKFKEIVARNISVVEKRDTAFTLQWSRPRVFANNATAIVALAVLDKRTAVVKNEALKECKRNAPLCLRKSPSEVKPMCAAGYTFVAVSSQCLELRNTLIYTLQGIGLKSMLDEENANEKISTLSISPLLPRKPAYIAVDAVRELLYVVDGERNELWRCQLDSTHARPLIDGGTSKIASLAVETVTGSLYVSFQPTQLSRNGHIRLVSPHDGRLLMTVVREDDAVPRHINIDAEDGYLFWTVSKKGVIRSRLDGTSVKTIINKENVTSLTIVIPQKILCYLVATRDEITCTDYDGRSVLRTAMKNIGRASSMAFYGNFLAIACSTGKEWKIVDILLNNNATVINRQWRVSSRVIDMAVYDVAQKKITNACVKDNGGCEQYCMHLGNDKVRCTCMLSKVVSDGKSCEAHNAFLAVSRGRFIEFLAWARDDRRTSSAYMPVQKENLVRNAVALTADKERSLLIFSDIHLKRIQAVSYNGSQHFTVVENIGSVEGLSYDAKHRDLYFTSLSERSILRVSMANGDLYSYPKKPNVVLRLSKADNPRGISVDPCTMTIYYTNWRDDHPSIEKVFYSGYGREKVITEDIVTPNAVVIDFAARKLYWSDARLDKIERCDMDGRQREVVMMGRDTAPIGLPAHPFALYVLGDTLFFSDWIHRSVFAVDKLDGGNVRLLLANITEQPMGIVAVDNRTIDTCDLDLCRTSNLECEDECRLNALGEAHCACFDGRRLNSDNRTCSGEYLSRCALNEWACSDNGKCIRYEETCDMVKDCPFGEDEDRDFCASRTCRDGYFSCGNGLCIPARKKCDKVNDCKNYLDEIDCHCSPNEFKCKSGMCIDSNLRCDYKMHCNDASDEMDCSSRNCSEVEAFGRTMINCGRTTQCILPTWFCDGSNDCWDGWDEEDCPDFHKISYHPSKVTETQCGDYQYRCNSTGTCIPQAWVCDGHQDCADSTDESSCRRECNPDEEHTCSSTGKCLEKRWKCDGNDDCGDGSDELNCDGVCDEKNHFTCANGNCIPVEWRCDGTDDCMDKQPSGHSSDENGCDESLIVMLRACKQNEFTCKTTGRYGVQCIPRRHCCDGERDCDDGSDEPPSCGRRQCTNKQFRCSSGQCISRFWTCNGIRDCSDGSDESPSLCADVSRGECGAKMFQCRNGVCIDNALVCNGKDDCGDSSDEPRNCNVDECSSTPCEERCVDLPFGYRCECTAPKVLDVRDNRSCIARSQCIDFPCSQHCLNKGDSNFECSCDAGYGLAPDGRTCRHLDSIEPELLLINRHFIRLYTLSGTPRGALLTNLSNGVAVDYDILSQLVYWTDVTHTGSTIGYTSLSKQSGRYKVLSGLFGGSPDGLAVDWLGRNIYWCDKDGDSISVADLKGYYRHILLKGSPLHEPRAIVLDPVKSILFWSDWGDRPHIGRMDMDGENPKLIITTSLKWPNAIAVDVTTKRLFWGDGHLDYIGSADYDGQNRLTVISKIVRHVFGLTVFEDFLYWTDWSNRTVERAHKIRGDMHHVILNFSHYRPMGIKVVHPLLQMTVQGQHLKHPCRGANPCDNLCLLSTNKKGYTCACAQGFRPDGENCIPDCKPTDFICHNTFKCLPFWWQCDGQDDCGDMEDEHYGACSDFKCELGQMACKSNANTNTTKCISPQEICDGKRDCPEGDDEKEELCKHYQCVEGQFKCTNTSKCISSTAVCDGADDCGDNEDERTCGLNNCSTTEHRCSSGLCIPYNWVCDGQIDCDGGSDEQGCSTIACDEEQFACGGNISTCISKSWVCDGEMDCEDGSDEFVCGDDYVIDSSDCDFGHFRCADGQKCVPMSVKCDGRKDCNDFSDELNCGECRNGTLPCGTTKIRCIFPEQFCDQKVDCDDFSDELYCSCSLDETADGDWFRCFDANAYIPHGVQAKHYCIPRTQVCDGVAQCPNGHDEDPRVCALHVCGDNYLKCKNNMCYLQAGLCDGVADCEDESDEKNFYCNKTCRNAFRCVTDGRCLPYSRQCDGNDDCDDGSDEANCDVMDLCIVFGTCTQECVSKKPFVKCACALGYSREYWQRDRCKASGSRTGKAAILDGSILHMIAHLPNSSNPKIETLGIGAVGDFDFSVDEESSEGSKQKLLYLWSDLETRMVNYGLLSEMLSLSYIVRDKQKDDKQQWRSVIAYDWINRNVYQTERTNNGDLMITVSPLSYLKSNNSRLPVLWGTLTEVSAMVVAPNRLTLCWAVIKPYPAIETSFLDGSDRRAVVLNGIYTPTGLTVDEPNNRLYWADVEKGTVETVTITGKDRRVIRKYGYQNGIRHDRPLLVDVFEEMLYIVGSPNGSVWKTHKFGRMEDIPIHGITVFTSSPRLLIVHPAKRYPLHSSCSMSKCGGQACIPNRSGASYSCLCPPGTVFSTKMGNCIQIERHDGFREVCGTLFCLNGGVCNKAKTECICPKGLRGEFCETDICYNHCLNGGNCTVIFDSKISSGRADCSCPPEYMGDRCQLYKCTGRCGLHGTCSVSTRSGLPVCSCDPGYIGADCSQQIDPCTSFCFNDGRCYFSDNTAPFCKCRGRFVGKRCENCIMDTGQVLVCHNGGHCKIKKGCLCPLGYNGTSCENDLCAGRCQNGGTCVLLGGNKNLLSVRCKCLPGFSGTRCEDDWCYRNGDHCMNGGHCLHDSTKGPICVCPSKYRGIRCEQKQQCEEFCLNESQCESLNNSDWFCKCRPGYSGMRCDDFGKCSDKCENGARCRIDEEFGAVCDCPRGLAGPRCDVVDAKSCSEIGCQNGGRCLMKIDGSIRCLCPSDWAGLLCTLPVCQGYCYNGGLCSVVSGQAVCTCTETWVGNQCQFLRSTVEITSTKSQNLFSVVRKIIVLLAGITAVVIALLYMVFRKQFSVAQQFSHARMRDTSEGNLDEFYNPAFMAGEFENVTASPTESTNFTNPIYESVYNDTVREPLGHLDMEGSELLSHTNQAE